MVGKVSFGGVGWWRIGRNNPENEDDQMDKPWGCRDGCLEMKVKYQDVIQQEGTGEGSNHRLCPHASRDPASELISSPSEWTCSSDRKHPPLKQAECLSTD